jgi:S-(hydroxymethyl)glutathione dehydrogenase / alcohol dehydrogenase
VKAMVLREYGAELALEDVHLDVPAPDEVLVRVMASGVCHSDRTAQLGGTKPALPVVLGHEVSGLVEAVGSRVTYVQPGDPVVACLNSFCGACEWCLRGQVQHCLDKRRTRAPGQSPRMRRGDETIDAYVGLGGFAEQILVHERTVAKLPPEMPFAPAALIGCAVATGMGAVRNTAQVGLGQTVVVIGCGGVGLNVIQAASLSGAGMIIAVDRSDSKLELAQKFGATHGVDAGAGDPVEAVRELSGGGVDHVFEVVGRPATAEQGFEMLRTRGTLTIVGVPHLEDRLSLPLTQFIGEEKRIQGSKLGASRFRLDAGLYAQLYLDKRLLLDELIFETVPLTSVNKALQDLDHGRHARTVLSFAGAGAAEDFKESRLAYTP